MEHMPKRIGFAHVSLRRHAGPGGLRARNRPRRACDRRNPPPHRRGLSFCANRV